MIRLTQQILDHAELTFPFEGPAQFIDVESLKALRADPEAVASVYRDEVRRFIERYRDACRSDNIDFVQVDTMDSFDRVLLSFLRTRQTKF